MEKIFTSNRFNQKTLFLILSLFTLGAFSNLAWGQSYHDGEWYSLWDTNEYSKTTALGGEIHTYSDIFIPHTGNFTIGSKLPGKDDSGKESSNSDPHDYGVESYQITFGGKTVDVSINATTTKVEKSGSGKWYNPYKWTFYYSYNYQNVSGTGLNSETNSFIVNYEYKLANTLRTVYIKNAKIPVAKHIRLEGDTYGVTETSATLNATAYGNTSAAYHINLRSFYVSGTQIKYVSDNSEFHFGSGATTKTMSVKANSCAAAGGSANCASTATSLGNPDNQEVDVYFTPGSNKNGSSSATITIYDGATKRATITLTAKVIPTYYFKATAVATDGGAEVKASFTENSFSEASVTKNITANGPDVANLTTTAYYYAPLNKGDYYFQGWYATADCSGERLSAEQNLSRSITSSSLNSGAPVEGKYYAQYKQIIRAEFSGESQTLNVDDTYNGISYIRTSAENASSSADDDFWYEIKNNTPSGNTTGSTHPDEIISYDPATKIVTAHNAGTATLVLHQKEVGLYVAVDKEYVFTVNKHQPVFTWNSGNATYYYQSSIANVFSTTGPCAYTLTSNNEASAKVENNTLKIYNVEEQATITATQEENYKWAGKTQDYVINPVELNNHVPFSVSSSNRSIFEIDNTTNVSWDGNGYKMGTGTWGALGNPDDNIILGFTGIPDKLTFTRVNDKSLGQLPVDGDCLFEVYESVDGNSWPSKATWSMNTKQESGNYTVQLSPTTRYIKLRYNGTVYGRFNNISVTELNKFSATPNPLDFGTKGRNFGTQTEQITFAHANAGRITTVAISGTDAAFFSVDRTTIGGTGRDKQETVHLDVTFDNGSDNRGENPYNAVLTISDNKSHSLEIPLTGVRSGKLAPEFIWNANHLPYYFNTTIAYVASSSNKDANCPLTYSTSDASIAEVSADGTLHIYQTGSEVTITVYQNDENSDYNAGSASFTFTPREKPDLSVPFQLTNTIYNNGVTAGARCYWENDENGRIRVGNDNILTDDFVWEHSEKNFTITFDGTPDRLSFEYKEGTALATTPDILTDIKAWDISESADGYTWTSVWSSNSLESSWTTVSEVSLSESTRFIRFTYSGNYWAYFRNINVSELVGYKYLRAESDGRYLSRGAKWGTQAVVDHFGMASRITRYTSDNENEYTRFRFVDNQQYLYENPEHEIYTDHGTAANTNNLWKMNDNGGVLTFQSGNDVGDDSHKGYYVTLSGDALALTNDASAAVTWRMEDYTDHAGRVTELLDEQAAAAAYNDFGSDVNTLAKVRNRLATNDFETVEIDIPELALGEQSGYYRDEEAGPNAIYDQVVTDLEPGFYRLTVKAFYRISNADVAWACHSAGMESVLGYVYANDVQYPIQSLYHSYHENPIEASDELRNGFYYSTTLTSAEKAFSDANRYLNDVYVYVNADEGKTTGTLRYGIKNPSYVPGVWLVYKDIKLARLARKIFIFEGEGSDENQRETWTQNDNWDRNDTPTENSIVIIRSDVTISSDVNVYCMTIEEGNNVTLSVNGKLTVGDGEPISRESYGNMHIEKGGELVLDADAQLQVNDFILDADLGDGTATAGRSGQIKNVSRINVNRDAYFDLALDPSGECSQGWYDFTVPFPVDALHGITRFDNTTKEEKTIQNEVNYAIMDFDEARHIESGYGWKKFRSVMKPGKCYTITIDDVDNVYRFKKTKDGAFNSSLSESLAYTETDDTKRGWNGMGNGTSQYINLAVDGVEKVQLYAHSTNSYSAVPIDDYTYVVGSVFFVQAPNSSSSMEYTHPATNKTLRAPQRNATEVSEFTLSLKAENADIAADWLYLSANEDALDTYEIGRDLAKMGTPTNAKIAQLWGEAYGMKLCDADLPLVDNEAYLPLGIFAPANGQFSLAIDKAPEDATLYLTQDGQIIWNLSMSPYVMDLSKGVNAGYGLRIEAAKAPQITTGVDSVDGEENASLQAHKVLIDNTIYIVTPDGAMYDLVGKIIK